MLEQEVHRVCAFVRGPGQNRAVRFEIAGFVWFSGWNDMVNYNPFYAEHLAHFMRDLRAEFNTPNLPFVIGQMGVNARLMFSPTA